MTKNKNPQNVAEWVTELHRLSAMTGGYTKAQQEQASRALKNRQAQFGEWLKAHPKVEAPNMRSYQWKGNK